MVNYYNMTQARPE